jgi:hypothetical protein
VRDLAELLEHDDLVAAGHEREVDDLIRVPSSSASRS